MIRRALLGMAMTSALLTGATGALRAQTPTSTATATPAATPSTTPDGVIRGSVTMLTEGATLAAGSQVDVIILEDSAVAGSVPAPVVEGRFEIALPANVNRTYVPALTYEGVQYFTDPVILAPTALEATRDFGVYASTTEQPELSIALTVVTLLAIDPDTGQLGIVREDLVGNPSDRMFVSDEGSATLRVPAPDGVVDADGENPDGVTTLEGGIAATTTPIRAMTETSIITRFLVEYDRAEDEYVLRITAPLTTEQIILRVPEDYARRLDPEGAAEEGAREPFQLAGGGDPITVRTVVLEDVTPGDSLVVRLGGFGPETNRNVLASGGTAGIAAVAVLVIVVGAAVFAIMRRRRAEAI